MMDAGPTLEPKRSSVAASAHQCLESFQKCLLQASSVHPREISMVEDQAARFSTWAMGIGAFATGPSSMDHRLRYASEVQSVVTGLLESLDYRVRTCCDLLDGLGKSKAADVHGAVNERLGRSFVDMASEISHLNKVSNTIRRASKESQILKASGFRIKDDEGNDVEPTLLAHFARHIGDRFPNISSTIQQRLARAMLLRWKRIIHRRHRQGNTAIQPQNAPSIASPAVQPTVTSTQSNPKGHPEEARVAPSQIQTATTLHPEKFRIASFTPSVVSESKTIALGKHEALVFPPAPGFVAKRKYAKLMHQRTARFQNASGLEGANSDVESSLHELLKADLQAIGEVTCPYCLYALPAQEVFDKRKWQNHVKNDLDPYVCLFENCDQPDLLYSHSDEWLSHMHQHGRLWHCFSHRDLDPFSTREQYITHLREAHNMKLTDAQFCVLANKSTRKRTKLFTSCPLCGKSEAEVDDGLGNHITGHLRSLALKSLPSYQNEPPDDIGGGQDSIDASRPQSRSTVKQLEDDNETLEFGKVRGHHWRPRSVDVKPTNFLGDAHIDLDAGHMNASMVGSVFKEVLSHKSFASVEDDLVLQQMIQRKKQEPKRMDAEERVSSNTPKLGTHLHAEVKEDRHDTTLLSRPGKSTDKRLPGLQKSPDPKAKDEGGFQKVLSPVKAKSHRRDEWSQWAWDSSYGQYYRSRADLAGNLDFQWTATHAVSHNPRTDSGREFAAAYSHASPVDETEVSEYVTVSGSEKASRSSKLKGKGKAPAHDRERDTQQIAYDGTEGYYARYSYDPSNELYSTQQSIGDVESETGGFEAGERAAAMAASQAYDYGASASGGPSASAYYDIYEAYNEGEDEEPSTPNEPHHSKSLDYGNELVDPAYRIEPSTAFQPGIIFKAHWSEPPGSSTLADPVSGKLEIQNRFGTKFHVMVQRFIVVANDSSSCTCIPILTYGGMACKKRGVKPEKHGIIFGSGHKARLLEGEPGLGFAPIKVDMTYDGETISKESRVNYAQLETVKHNMPVLIIGHVTSGDCEKLMEYVNFCWDSKVHSKSRRR